LLDGKTFVFKVGSEIFENVILSCGIGRVDVPVEVFNGIGEVKVNFHSSAIRKFECNSGRRFGFVNWGRSSFELLCRGSLLLIICISCSTDCDTSTLECLEVASRSRSIVFILVRSSLELLVHNTATVLIISRVSCTTTFLCVEFVFPFSVRQEAQDVDDNIIGSQS
jgi:hypothetical protein